jgi:hypothetical protein
MSKHRGVQGPTTRHIDIYWWPELHFFDRKFSHGVSWYRSCFSLRRWAGGRDVLAGESTPSYLDHPDVPERVAATIPAVKLIVLLRDPIDRAYWHYEQMRRRGLEPRTFADALAAEERGDFPLGHGDFPRDEVDAPSEPYAYARRSRYADHLERWFEFFSPDQLLVLRAEDYATEPAKVYDEVLRFLGLPPWRPEEFEEAKWMTPAPIDRDLRAQLEERFAEPNARLGRLLGRDLGWTGAARTGGVAEQDQTASV